MLEEGLESLKDLADSIYLESLVLFSEHPETVEEYISTDEISDQDKIEDIDEMLRFAEVRELYEYCSMLKKMRDRING